VTGSSMQMTQELHLVAFEFRTGPELPAFSSLGDQDIHLWHADPHEQAVQLDQLQNLLSADELDRMRRFRFERDRHEFLFARSMLRTLLGAYLEIAGHSVRFAYADHGKPALAPPQSKTGLQFNLSHTSGAVLLAVSLHRSIGADIERVREDFEVEEIAARFFSQAEKRALLSLPPDQRHEAFFRCWTRKEALLKAKGDGLSFPLDQFDVSIAADEKRAALSTRPDSGEAARWQIFPVSARNGYAAAIAMGSNE